MQSTPQEILEISTIQDAQKAVSIANKRKTRITTVGSTHSHSRLIQNNIGIIIRTDQLNGKITINGKAHFGYKADIKGPNGYFSQKIFNHLYDAKIKDLSPGNYSICITSDEDINFESCFNTLLESPDPLKVLTELNYKNQSLTVDLSGASHYKILLNDSRYELNSGRHQLYLKEGLNRLEITTNHECQGKVEEKIYLSEVSTIYPNPAFNWVKVLLGGQANDFIISIFSNPQSPFVIPAKCHWLSYHQL